MTESLGENLDPNNENQDPQERPLEEINAKEKTRLEQQESRDLLEAEDYIYERISDFQERQTDADFALLYEQLFPSENPELILKFADYIDDLDLIPESLGDPILSERGAQRFNKMLAQGRAEELVQLLIANVNTFSDLLDRYNAPPYIEDVARKAALDLYPIAFTTNSYGNNEKGTLLVHNQIFGTWRLGESRPEYSPNPIEETTNETTYYPEHNFTTNLPEEEAQVEIERIENDKQEKAEEEWEEIQKVDPYETIQSMRELSLMHEDSILSSGDQETIDNFYETSRDFMYNPERIFSGMGGNEYYPIDNFNVLSDSELDIMENLPDEKVSDFYREVFLPAFYERNEDLLKFFGYQIL